MAASLMLAVPSVASAKEITGLWETGESPRARSMPAESFSADGSTALDEPLDEDGNEKCSTRTTPTRPFAPAPSSAWTSCQRLLPRGRDEVGRRHDLRSAGRKDLQVRDEAPAGRDAEGARLHHRAPVARKDGGLDTRRVAPPADRDSTRSNPARRRPAGGLRAGARSGSRGRGGPPPPPNRRRRRRRPAGVGHRRERVPDRVQKPRPGRRWPVPPAPHPGSCARLDLVE